MKIREFAPADLLALRPNKLCPDLETMQIITRLNGAEIFTITDNAIIAILCGIRRPNNIWAVFILASENFRPKHCKYLQNIVRKAITIYNPKLIYSVSEDVRERNRLQEFMGFVRRRKIMRDNRKYFVWVLWALKRQ